MHLALRQKSGSWTFGPQEVKGSESVCVRNERGWCPPIHAGRDGAGGRLEAWKAGPGGLCSRSEGNIISESPGAGAWMIPRLLGFAPGLSPLTHWLPAWQSPDQLLVSLSLLVCHGGSFSVRCRHQVHALPRLLGGKGCRVPGSSEAITRGVKRKQVGVTPPLVLALPTRDQVSADPGASELAALGGPGSR